MLFIREIGLNLNPQFFGMIFVEVYATIPAT